MTDLRLLNDVTIKDAYPLTNIPENLQKLKAAKIFTSIDGCDAYHCIQIEEKSRDCTTLLALLEHFVKSGCLLACQIQAVFIAKC